MTRDRDRSRDPSSEPSSDSEWRGSLTPGKRSLSQALPPAEAGASGGGTGPLPAGVLAKMERSFGTDFSGVRVQPSSAEAEMMGAIAFARGNDVHFAPGEYDPQAKQELLGHELAHVVQQRAGRVAAPLQAKGLPVVEDPALEAEADAAGARAAAGEPAGISAPGTSVAEPVLQGYFKITKDEFAAKKVAGADARFSAQQKPDNQESYLTAEGVTNIVAKTVAQIGGLRVSMDGKLAIEDGGAGSRQMKTFFIDGGLIDGCNSSLDKAGSMYRLAAAGGSLQVPDAKGGMHTLTQVVAKNIKQDTQGDGVTGPVNCDEMGMAVGGWSQDADKRLMLNGQSTKSTPKWGDEEGHRAAAYATEYAKRKDDYFGKQSGATKASNYAVPAKGDPIMEHSFVITVTTDDMKALKARFIALKINVNSIEEKGGAALLTVNQQQHDALMDDQGKGAVKTVTVTQTLDIAKDSGPVGLAAKLGDQRDTIAENYVDMITGAKGDAVAQKLGINEYANADVGDAFVTFSTGAKRADGVKDFESDTKINAKWGQHWGGVVARSGGDWITLENYDRQAEDTGNAEAARKNATETRAFFQMYGSEDGQTWHEVMKASGEFPNAISLSYRNKDRKS